MNNFVLFIIYLFILNILIIKGSTPRNVGNFNVLDVTDTIDEIAKSSNQVYSNNGLPCSKVSYVLIEALLPSVDTIPIPYNGPDEMIQLNSTFFLFKTTIQVPVGDIQPFYLNFETLNGVQWLALFEFDCKLPPNPITNQLVDNKIYENRHYKGMYGILVKNLNVEKYLVYRGNKSFVTNTFDRNYVDNGNQDYLNVNYNSTIYNIRPTPYTTATDSFNIKTKYASVSAESLILIQPFLKDSTYTKPIATLSADTTCTGLKYDQCTFIFNVQVMPTIKYFFLMGDEIKRPILVTGSSINGEWYVQIDNIASRLSIGQTLQLKLYSFDTTSFTPQKNIDTSYVGTLGNNSLVFPQLYRSSSNVMIIKIQKVGYTNYGSMYLDGNNYGYQNLIEIPDPFARVSNKDPTVLNEFWIAISRYALSVGTHFGFMLHYPKYPTPLNITIDPFDSLVPLYDAIYPELINVEYFDGLVDCTVRITASDKGGSGIQLIIISFLSAYNPTVTQYAIRITNQNLIEGDIEYGIYQFTIPKYVIRRNYHIKLLDHASNLVQVFPNQFYSGSKYLPSFPLNFLGPLDVKSISFQWNNIDLSTVGKNNTMYITLVDDTIENLVFQFMPSIGIDTYKSNQPMSLPNSEPFYTSTYNSKLKQYEIPFYLPARLPSGPISYLLNPLEIDSSTFYSYLGTDSELVVSSNQTDILPPIVESVLILGDRIIPNLDNCGNNSTVGYLIKVTDSLNGIKKVLLTVSSNLDFQGSTYTKEFIEPYPLQTDIEIVWNLTCRSIPQQFTISKFISIDGQGNQAEYPNTYKVNPFFKIMNSFDTFSNLVTTCQGNCLVIENEPPTLASLTVNQKNITNFLERTMVFNFFIGDYDSGMSESHLPIVYLISDQIEIISKQSHFVSGTFDSSKGVYQQIQYQVEITVPYLFGYPTGFMTQIYGVFDNHLNTNGLTPDKITAYDRGVSFINVTIGQPEPSIVNATLSDLTSTAMLTITGFKFGISPIVYLNVSSTSDGLYSTFEIATPYLTNGYIVIDPTKVRQSDNIPCSVKVFNPTTHLNSSYFHFELAKIINIPITISPSTTPTRTAPITPTPTIAPTCKGEPQCGGSNQGNCVLSVCKCISPWFGIDCTSQLATDIKPVYNSTQPEISIPYQPINSDEIVSSLVSVYSLRELKHDGQIINEYIFSNWNYDNTNTDNYTYSINIINKNDISKSTDIIVTIKQFTEKTNIEFAGQTITLQPSSIKYYITLSNYQFASNLNTLELVMYASIETSKSGKDNCYGSETGNSNTQDVSEYIKVQINGKSLYGEFIKRAIIDDKIGIVSNKMLSSTTEIGSNSYIAIQIPHYSQLVQIDPNFSVLIDSRPVENSICNDKSSGLTTPQLIGIIIGSVAFVAVAAIVSFSVIYKKSTYLRVKAKSFRLRPFKNK